MFINKSALIRHQSYNVSLQIVRNFIPKNFLNGLLSKENEEKQETFMRDLKKWRTLPNYINEDEILTSFKKSHPDKIFPKYLGRGSLSIAEDTESYIDNLKMKALDHDQKFIPERHQTLGNDLAVAHLIVSRRGKVRQLGCETFMTIHDIDELPTTYKPEWFLEEIDCSDMAISYIGLLNLKGLRYLKRATFKNCDYFDNWCLERIVALCPNLEYINVSDCKAIDENVLECLYRAWNLKEFVVTDWYGNPEFEFACLLLEDCKPDLVVKRLVKSQEEIPSNLKDEYVPTKFEELIMKFEKFIDSKRPISKQQ